MIAFKNQVAGTDILFWQDNGGNQIAFSRGNVGFVAFNNEVFEMKKLLKTALPEGVYCDIVSGMKNGTQCTGKQITVDAMGNAMVTLLPTDEDGFLAVHLNSKLD
jgi:alpha-amylase